MDYVLCTVAGKFPQCKDCPMGKPHEFGKNGRVCIVNQAVVIKSTKIHGTLMKIKVKPKIYTWHFKTEFGMVMDSPLVNKTAHKFHLSHDERAVIAWITSNGIEIIRFNNKGL